MYIMCLLVGGIITGYCLGGLRRLSIVKNRLDKLSTEDSCFHERLEEIRSFNFMF